MKITKKQYQAMHAVLTSAHAARVAEVESLIAAMPSDYNTEMADLINAMHDEVDNAERRINDLECLYDRRNWTTGDYQLHSLIAQNID